MDKNNTNIENNKNLDLSNYEDSRGVNLKRITFGLWYVEHRLIFIKIIIFLWIILSAGGIISFIYYYSHYIFIGMKEDEANIQAMLTTGIIPRETILVLAPRSLEHLEFIYFKNVNNLYDFAAKINNPNPKHWAIFDYYFSSEESKTPIRKGFILPGSEKYILSLNNSFGGEGYVPVIENLRWYKLNPHKIFDYQKFYLDRLNISIDEIIFLPENFQEGRLAINTFNFRVKNNSAFNYRDINFLILLYNNSNLTGVGSYALPSLMSGEIKNITMAWPGIITANEAIVEPEINILSENSYIKIKE